MRSSEKIAPNRPTRGGQNQAPGGDVVTQSHWDHRRPVDSNDVPPQAINQIPESGDR